MKVCQIYESISMKSKIAMFIIALAALSACGGGGSGNGSAAAPAPNIAPVAQIGAIQNMVTGTLVTLDGGASTDANGDTLVYSWVLASRPAGSAAALSSATTIKPTFTADVAGTYVATLIVNDGKVNSNTATVTITASIANTIPVANPGAAQNVLAGSTVTLDGSASSDANGDLLTYKWTFISVPAASTIQPFYSGQTSQVAQILVNVPGTYMIRLVVNDGKADSAPSTVTVTATPGNSNAVPVSNAGVAQYVVPGSTVKLSGLSSSDTNKDPLTYQWALTLRPSGSNAALSSVTSAQPSFVADVGGYYLASLIVNDGKANSGSSMVSITATTDTTVLLHQLTAADGTVSHVQSAFPYNGNFRVRSSCAGACLPAVLVDTFTVMAVGSNFTIGNLVAKDSTGIVVPSFDGLTQGQIISRGSSVAFNLQASRTYDATAQLVYQFTVVETGQTFVYNAEFKTN